MPLRIEHEALPKQWEFITSDADEVLYSGAYGAGKTRALCLWAVLRAAHPAARVLLFRMKLQDLLNTTLATLLEGDGELGPVLPPGSYRHNRQTRTIRIHGGGTIIYDQVDDIDRIASLNASAAGGEEVSELDLGRWLKIGGRIRVKVPGMRPQLVGVTNPASVSHFLAQRFGLRGNRFCPELAFRGDPRQPMRPHAVMTSVNDNPFLPPEYVARLAGYTGVMRRRYVLGEWCANEGAIYERFSREKHVADITGKVWARTFVAIDDGTTNPASILLIRVDGDGRLHVEREVQRSGMTNAEKVAVVKGWPAPEFVVVDPAASSLKLELRQAGLAVYDGKNDVIPGIQAVTSQFEPGPDGAPRLTIAPGCTKLVEQIENYEWKDDGKEKPVKEDDHGPDALRYAVMAVARPIPTAFDAADLAKIEQRTRRRVGRRGWISHAEPMGDRQDRALMTQRIDQVRFRPDVRGPFTIYHPMEFDRPAFPHTRMIFVAAAEQGSPSHLAVVDADERTIIATWSNVIAPERLARFVAMLSLWYADGEGEPASIGVFGTAPGRVMRETAAALGASVQDAWEPSPKEFAEAVGQLRAGWECGNFTEADPAVFAVARQYVWSGERLMHASLLGETEHRGVHVDPLIVRAGLVQMLGGYEPPPPPERVAPAGSPAARERRRAEGRLH